MQLVLFSLASIQSMTVAAAAVIRLALPRLAKQVTNVSYGMGAGVRRAGAGW